MEPSEKNWGRFCLFVLVPGVIEKIFIITLAEENSVSTHNKEYSYCKNSLEK